MTAAHINSLVKYNKDTAYSHKQLVLDAVRNLGNPLPKEINEFLDEQAENEANSRYENGHISKKQLEKEANEKKLSMRTILRKLAELTKAGLLEHQNNRYSVSKKAQSDIRYYAQLFGLEALTRLMGAHYPELFPLEKNIDELVKIFGTYIVFCFIEAARPTHSNDSSTTATATTTTNLEKDRLADSWIKGVFTPWNMYNSFFAAITNQLDDKAVQKYAEKYMEIAGSSEDDNDNDNNNHPNISRNIKKDENGHFVINDAGEKIYYPNSTSHFATKRFHLLTSSKFNYEDKSPPQYELDSRTIKRITGILKEKYPQYYERLFEVRAEFLGKPKERSRRENRGAITQFDKEKDE
jgi:hypothetical protein